MRKTIKQIIDSAQTGIDWYQMGSIDDNPSKPFGVYRMSGSQPGLTSRSPGRDCSLELTVHDDPGSYLRIDATLSLLEQAFNSVEHASAAPGERITEATWVSRSPDLNDDGFNTIIRTTTYRLIGRGQ